MITKITNNFLRGEKTCESIGQAAFLIAIMGLASRFLGLIRDRILAAKFGAGDELDIYYAAFKIPDLIFNLLILGALSAAFVPVFTSLISNEKKKEAWELVNNIFSLILIVLLAVALILFILAPQLAGLITFGFSQEKQQSVVMLTRIMLLSPILLGFSGILGGILNSFKKFFFYSLSPIFYNLGIIIGALFFTQIFGLAGLAWGVVLGALLHLLVQIPETIRCGLQFKFRINIKNENLKKVIFLMIPRTMGLAVAQVNFLIVTVLASTLAAGSLAIFNLANNIQSVPLGMIGISLAIAAFPTLSCAWAKKDKKEFTESFSRTFTNITFFIIPFSAVLITLRAQIVRIILGTGRFDWEDTILTFQALGIFSLSLFAQSLIPLIARTFYAIHNTKTPFYAGLFSEAINLILALLLIGKYGILGLVWAFSISTTVNMFLLLIILHGKIGNFREERIIPSVWRIIVTTLAMVVGIQIIKYEVSYLVDMTTFLGVFTQAASALFGGLIIFLLIGRILKLKELEFFICVLKRKTLGIKTPIEDKRDEIGGI